MGLGPRTLEKLCRAVGRDHVVWDAYDLVIFERDASIAGALPDAIVYPANVEEVAAVLEIAAEQQLPVVPRGAGTGLSGGAVTLRGGLALSLARLRRIIEIDPKRRTALVEPGVVNYDLGLEAARHGLFYAPDPSSQKACTIGGNVAENSGGPHTLAYGVTVNHVTGLEVALASGELIQVGGRNAAEAIGYDLTGVLVGVGLQRAAVNREQAGIGRAGLADRERRHRNALGHLHDGQQRIQSFEVFRGNRHAQHRQRSLRSNHAREVRCAAGAGDEALRAALGHGGDPFFE